MERLGTLLLVLPALVVSVVAHEWAHARVAVWQGDPTPREAGRLTLNPIPHLDLWGSFLVPALLWVTPGMFIFGWAKPVPVDPGRFREPRRGDVLVSLAGVTANFLLVGAFVVLMALAARAGAGGSGPLAAGADGLRRMARYGIFLNAVLGVFNLVPVPPLDGSHVLAHLLPRELRDGYRRLGRYSFVLLILIMFVPEILDVVLYPVRWVDGLALAAAGWLS